MGFKVTDELKAIWLAALEQEYGLEVKSTNNDLTLQDLYETRKAMHDPRLATLRIIRLKDALFIVKQELSLEEIEKELANAPTLT